MPSAGPPEARPPSTPAAPTRPSSPSAPPSPTPPASAPASLLLALALGDAGHTEESFNYFLGLWETQPGDGFINLSLARLAAKKNDIQAAINYYRASIFGTWQGDGVLRRREVRLELSQYFIAHHDLSPARTELLIIGGNAPEDVPLSLTLAQLLEQAQAPHDALTYYRKVLTQEPKNQIALDSAARLEYDSGHFDEAHRLMEQVIHQQETSPSTREPITPSDKEMLEDSARILELAPSRNCPTTNA
ncbi:hypothetical protein RBB78_23235 [Tunturiibacter empetritectus]|uniref:tetratricopeptide repeat protein n=1 Tax=Tunturiibacter empetritectus TaxID=3069691 RepID=UPI003D9B640E